MLPDIFQGQITAWWGSLVAIPPGWALCDGNNGTPDLRDEFIVVAGDTYVPDDSGGTILHAHDFTTLGHGHNIPGGSSLNGILPGYDGLVIADVLTGTTNNGNILGPYYALAYIMKL